MPTVGNCSGNGPISWNVALASGTALAIILASSISLASDALAADVEVNSPFVGQYFPEQFHPGGGTFLLTRTGFISDNGNFRSALSTDAYPAPEVGWDIRVDGSILATGPGGSGVGLFGPDKLTIGVDGNVSANGSNGKGVAGVAGADVTNYGTISGQANAILVNNGSLSLTNHAGAIINGTVQMAGGSGGTVDNAGTISGGTLMQIVLRGDSTLINRASGRIESTNNGVFIQNGTGNVENGGRIVSTPTATSNSAVYLHGSGSLLNAQSGEIRGSIGVRFGNSGAVTAGTASLVNHGTISGTNYYPVLFQNVEAASLINTGSLVGGQHGVLVTGTNASIIDNTGLIRGDRAIVFSGSGMHTIANSGQIVATSGPAISKTGGSFDLVLRTGSQITGDVIGSSSDTLRLEGMGSEDAAFKGFGTVSMAGSQWMLSGTVHGESLVVDSGVLTLTGDASFTNTSVSANGRLIVNGLMQNTAVTVENGGVLGGSGDVGPVAIGNGGILTPGNSIGTLNVVGDLTFAAGGRYDIEVDSEGTASDKVVVVGTATIKGGTVAHIGYSGTYKPLSTYRILEAGMGLSGAFGQVTSDFAFLVPELIYNYNAFTVDLSLARNDIDFAAKASTRNQRAAATGAESLGMGHNLYDIIVGLPDEPIVIGVAFDALSGELYASTRTALIEDSRLLRDAVNDRLRAAFARVDAPAMPMLAYAQPGLTATRSGAGAASSSAGPVDGLAVWGQGFGSWGYSGSDGNAAELKRSTGGFVLGADAALADNLRLGILGGYSHTSFDVWARNSGGWSNNYHLGLYGGTDFSVGPGTLGLRTGLAYSWHDINTSRQVNIGTFSDSPQAHYSAGTMQAFGEVAYRSMLGQAFIEPFAALAYVGLDTDDFQETGLQGANEAAIAGTESSTDTTFTTLGLRASTYVAFGGVRLTLSGALGWRHAFGDLTPMSTHAFATGVPFSVAGTPIASDAAVLEVGLGLGLTDATSLNVTYEGQIADSGQDHGLLAKLIARF
ncbi:autotransporter domain-containing protein [Mesorhizobium sp. 1B3]|uniref:autotransporter family protein n=1 Tax=Mesorhizobium sp. 1B3 TaxID=3243599 RepID=UPI003D95E157